MIKWIVCDVAPTRRVEFSRARELWAVLRPEDGFVCQVGGWDEKSPDTAGVLAVWTDAEAYERFMRDSHDAIVCAPGQQETCRSVRVATGPSILEMRGDRNGVEVLLTAGVLRVADCVVLPGHEDHFKRVQEHGWLPGMAGVDGMLGGLFCQVGERGYLTTTGWRDARSMSAMRTTGCLRSVRLPARPAICCRSRVTCCRSFPLGRCVPMEMNIRRLDGRGRWTKDPARYHRPRQAGRS